MKILKNTLTILIVFCLSILILGGNVEAATASVSATSKVSVGQNVTVSVSFSEKVEAAQFKLDYDRSKFEYVSSSVGQYFNASNGRVAYDGMGTSFGSITFTFKAKTVGAGTFSISKLVLSSSTASIARGSTSVTIEEAKQTNTNNKPSTTTKKPTTNKNTNQNKEDENKEPEQIDKSALDILKTELEAKVQTDYTEESWKALQDIISKAESATKNSEYDEVKDKLNLEGLVPVTFEKEELFNMLIELVGKAETNYTEESWKELEEAIKTAQSAKLKSEYDEVKDKLTIETLVEKEPEKEKNFFKDIIEELKGKDPLLLVLMAGVIVLTIVVLILLILYGKARKSYNSGARRLK